MRNLFVFATTLLLVNIAPVLAQTAVYQPLGTWIDPQRQAYADWEQARQSLTVLARPIADEARPQLAGLRPKPVEIFAPKMLQKRQQERLVEIDQGIGHRIAELQQLPVH